MTSRLVLCFYLLCCSSVGAALGQESPVPTGKVAPSLCRDLSALAAPSAIFFAQGYIAGNQDRIGQEQKTNVVSNNGANLTVEAQLPGGVASTAPPSTTDSQTATGLLEDQANSLIAVCKGSPDARLVDVFKKQPGTVEQSISPQGTD